MPEPTLAGKIRQITNRYPLVSADKFFYVKESDLSKRFNKVKAWFLIYDASRGYSIIPIDFRRKLLANSKEWGKLFTHGLGKYSSLFSIFSENIIPAINNKSGAEWEVKTFIGFAGADAIRQTESTDSPRRRNQTVKKGNTNERHKHRRRHRNKKRKAD